MIRFGTGGWRAVVGEEFIKSNVLRVGQAIANYVKRDWEAHPEKRQGFVVGYDRRFLSDRGAHWMVGVLTANNVPVLLIEKDSPTPLTMFTIGDLGYDYGLAITASHNSYEYNGVKFFIDGGRDASVEVTEQLEVIMESLAEEEIKFFEYGEALASGNLTLINPLNAYIDRILSYLDVEAIKQRNLKVLLDPMFGVSKTSLQTVLITCRCNVDVINDRHDMMFGGNLPTPSAENLNRLKQTVVKEAYDLGIATDGDADRVGIVDEKGNYIHPNAIMVLLYYYFLEYKGMRGAVIRNVATTHLLDRIAKAYGQEAIEVPVGFKHISNGMEKYGAILGGESSGGLTSKGHIRGKDGIYASSLIVEMICVTGLQLSEILHTIHEKYGKLYMVEKNYPMSQKQKEDLQHVLFAEKKIPDYAHVLKVSYLDGLKIFFEEEGWVIARFSGTEPLLRIYAEMDSEEQAVAVVDKMARFLGIENLEE